MSAPVTPNDLDKAVLAMKRSNAAMPDLCRCLREGDLWVLLPYHPELADQDFELKNGMPFPFAQFQGEHGLAVPVFSSEARLREGLKRGNVPPGKFLPGTMPALQLLEVLGKSEMKMTLNKGCTTGEITLPPKLLRDLASGSALKPQGLGSGKTEQLTLKVFNPADYPKYLVQSVFDLCRKHHQFRAVWIFTRKVRGQRPPALPPCYLLVLMDPRDEVLFHDFNLVAQSAREKHTVSISLADEKNAPYLAGVFRKFKPFYVAADYHPTALPEGGEATSSSKP